ncbi:[acyl-carrier-protein] S-malonyltransferase [bacterium]|nr:MAG: [acyl-carrier-protein] S-malonyltransferase [bacterium]
MTYALVFPGQGSQYAGMGLELAKQYREAQAVFKEADAALGRPLSSLIENGPREELALTWNTQPAILTASVAVFRALSSRVSLRPIAMAGHSLGEYSALVASGAMEFSDAVRIVEKRGQFMQEAVPVGEGAMYAVLGLDTARVEAICAEHSTGGKLAAVANDNCPGQVVISGHADTLLKVAEALKSAGAKRAVKLEVSAPFHCSLMNPAAEKLAGELAKVKFSTPIFPVVANADAKRNTDSARIPELLRKQVFSPVLWQGCVKALSEMGADTFIEVGPGKVLSGLIKRIEEKAAVLNVENAETLDACIKVL